MYFFILLIILLLQQQKSFCSYFECIVSLTLLVFLFTSGAYSTIESCFAFALCVLCVSPIFRNLTQPWLLIDDSPLISNQSPSWRVCCRLTARSRTYPINYRTLNVIFRTGLPDWINSLHSTSQYDGWTTSNLEPRVCFISVSGRSSC